MIYKEEIQEFTTPSNEWIIQLAENAIYPYVESIFGTDGKPLHVDYVYNVVDDTLVISFGLESYAGVALYSWREAGGNTSTTDDDNTVNITVNQSSTGSTTTPTSSVINITDTRLIEVENDSIHSRQIKVYQLVSSADGFKTYQDITDAVDIFYKERISDGKKFIIVESNVPFSGFIELF